MTKKKLNKILELHKKWLTNKDDGVRADLRKANLRGVDLEKAQLQESNLQGADLQGANLQEANLQGAQLQGAQLREANLQGADLRGAQLQESDLQGAYLQRAIFCNTYFKDTIISYKNEKAKLDLTILEE